MTQQQKFASDYNDVAARIAEFRAKYPEGSLQPANLAQPFTVMTIGGKERIVVVAAAYRTPDDPRPGIGMAYEEVPGRTPYTRDSELQNAETSAWGRAIVAALAADTKKGIASAEEVRNRQAEREDSPSSEDFRKKHNRMVAQTLDDPHKADRGVPADDPWQKPIETDAAWMGDWIDRASNAPTLEQLQTLWAEATDKRKNLHVSDEDFTALTGIKDNRKTELSADAA